jgi:hypothetical protein
MRLRKVQYLRRRRVRRRFTLIAVLGASLLAGVASATSPTTVEVGRSPLSFSAGLTPKKLPPEERTPVAVGVSGKISSGESGTLREATVSFDRNGAIDVSGLPTCTRNRLLAANTLAARRECRKAIVGAGIAHIKTSASQPEPISIPLTLVNGGLRDGTVTVFIHGVIPTPSLTPAIATVTIKKVRRGRYGLQAVSRIPPIADGNGSLLDFSFVIDRRFMYDGVERSFATARCPDGHLDGQLVSFSLSSGKTLPGERFARSCTPTSRGRD